jgi:glycosyltransferase involved in cell wall biosynthesis
MFRPFDRQKARASLGLSQTARVLLFVASGVRANTWKDYETLESAVAKVGESPDAREIVLLAVGEDAPPERRGPARVIFVPYQDSIEDVARYYQAADLYVHAAHADTFPTTILEALACGTPVVATAVGGIPEQVRGLATGPMSARGRTLNRYAADQATGVLVPPGDASAMAESILYLLGDPLLRERLSANAAADANRRFGVERQADDYLSWYADIMERSRAHPRTFRRPAFAS